MMTHPEIVRKDLEEAIKKALDTGPFAMPRILYESSRPFRPPVRRQVPPGSRGSIPLSTPLESKLKKVVRRNRKLTYADVIKALIFMEGGSLQKELRSVGLDITAPAFIYRRHQIPPALFDDILTTFNATAPAPKRFRDWRVLACDGTTVNMARDPDSPCFVRHASAPDGYCQAHVTPLYDVITKEYVSAVIQPQPEQDEIGALDFMLTWEGITATDKVLIVADRAFSSYNLFATLQEKGIDFLIRTKNSKGGMREVAKLPMEELDTEIQFTITTENTKEAREKGFIWVQTRKKEDRKYSDKTRAGRWDHPSPYPMKLRIVRILLDSGEYETLVTSLPKSVTPQDIRELYHARWGVESAFLELKYSFGLDNLHGKSWEFTCQEVMASMLMANICSRIMNEVVIQRKSENKYAYTINRKMAVRLIKEYMRTPDADGNKLMKEIARYTLPIRPGRKDKRKLRPKTFKEFVFRVAA